MYVYGDAPSLFCKGPFDEDRHDSILNAVWIRQAEELFPGSSIC